jgi:hypothetical protein
MVKAQNFERSYLVASDLNTGIIHLSSVKDSSKRTKIKLVNLDTTKFRHAIDLRYIYDINLGYNFSYHFLPKRLGIGLRAGLWYKKKDYFPGGIYSRYGIKFSGDLYIELTLWKSIYLQTGVAFQNELLWPAKDNPVQGPAKIREWGVAVYLKPTFVFFKHYMLSAGVSWFTFLPYKYNFFHPIISIGYKF